MTYLTWWLLAIAVAKVMLVCFVGWCLCKAWDYAKTWRNYHD